MSAAARVLVVNADDLGMHERVDDGILEAHERGIVTSTSLMVHGESAGDGAARAGRSGLSVGLHIDLSRWDHADGDAQPWVESEVRGQLSRFRELVGSDPTHLDSHHHVHRDEPVRSVAIALSRELNVPLRFESEGIAYCGAFYGQTGRGEPHHEAITAENLIALLTEGPPGVSELGCHPGRAVGPDVSSYASEREIELAALCDAQVKRAVDELGVALCSFPEVTRAG